MSGFLQDNNGNDSSKRLLGAILIIVGCLIILFISVYSVFKQAVDKETAVECSKYVIGIGSGLVVLGLFEKWE